MCLLRLVAPPRNTDENVDADRFEGDLALNVEDADDIGMGDMGLDMGVIGRGDGDISGSVARTYPEYAPRSPSLILLYKSEQE